MCEKKSFSSKIFSCLTETFLSNMTKPKGIFKKRRRIFCVNKNRKNNVVQQEGESFSSSQDNTQNLPKSSSNSKISANTLLYEEFDSENRFDIVNVEKLSKALNKIAVCKDCAGQISLRITNRSSLASTIAIKCDNCHNNENLRNSDKVAYNVEGK